MAVGRHQVRSLPAVHPTSLSFLPGTAYSPAGSINADGCVHFRAFVERSILHQQAAAANVTDIFGWIALDKDQISGVPGSNRTDLVFLLQKPGGMESRDLQRLCRRDTGSHLEL